MKTARIGELQDRGIAELTTGPFGTQLSAAHYSSTGTPVMNVRNFGFGEVRATNLEFLPEEHVRRLERHLLREGDIVFGRKGAVDRHALITSRESGWIQGSDCMRLRLDPSVVDPRFVSFAFRTKWHQRWMQNHCSFGATMASLNQEVLALVEIPLPAIEVQQAIAGALGMYDDLIENNRRRIEVLEEVARLLYREWFVYFRFPGYEDVEMVNSVLGPVPEGWEVSLVGDAIETIGGGTPSREVEAYWEEGNVQWFTPTDLTRSGSAFSFDSDSKITELGLKKSSAKLFPSDSVMMTSRATIGVISISTTPATTNQGFITCVPSEQLPSTYLYFWLHDNVDLFLGLAGGATFKELRKSTFRDLPILVPDSRAMGSFQQLAEPQMALIRNLLRQNEVLREARDLLLPRLVSGELDVSELDLNLEDVGA